MRCPICQRETIYEGNAFRPFCSERCKLIDLDNWLAGRYRVSAPLDGRQAPGDEGARREIGESDSTER